MNLRLTHSAFALVLLGALTWSGCGSPEPYDWDAVVSATPSPTPSPSPPTKPRLVVYLDTSASMAGYVSPNGQNVYGATLRTLRDVVTSFKNPLEVSVRSVDVSVKAPDPDGALALQKASISPTLYRGGETDLAGAIASFDPNRERAAGATAAVNGESAGEQAEPPERFHILVTDGVQSKKSQDAKQACLKGSDPTCVREKIINLLKKDWGAYVIGLRSQFHGTVYSEVNGAKVQYDTSDSNPKRFRPFYLYIFSPDRVALDEFAATLRERLRPVIPPETMRVLALTSPYTKKMQKAEVTIPEGSADAVTIYEQLDEPARLALEVDPNVEEAAPLPVEVAVDMTWSEHVLDSGAPPELASLLRWEVTPVKPAEGEAEPGGAGVRYPTVKVDVKGGSVLNEQGRVPVRLTVGWPRTTAKPAWRAYALRGYLDLGMGHEPLPWIRQWSTDLDITADRADRTLNLESVLTGLWRNPILEGQVVAEVFLQIGPQ